MAISEKQQQQRKAAASKGGKALVAKYGPEYMGTLGKKGGRPTWDVQLEKDLRREAELRVKARLASRPGRRPGGGDK